MTFFPAGLNAKTSFSFVSKLKAFTVISAHWKSTNLYSTSYPAG